MTSDRIIPMLSGRGSHSLPDDNQQPQTEMMTSIKLYNSQMIVLCNFVEDHKQQEESIKGWMCASPAAVGGALFWLDPGPLFSYHKFKVKDQHILRCHQASMMKAIQRL